jgi:hypothetical protein
MTSTGAADELLSQVAGGHALSDAQLLDLAARTEILQIGMLADAARRHRHGLRTTYGRVAVISMEERDPVLPPTAGEVELTGHAPSLDAAVDAIARVRAGARDSISGALARLKAAGLDALASLPLDHPGGLDAPIAALAGAGFARLRLSIDAAPMADRLGLFRHAERLQAAQGCIQALDPLPRVLHALRPTTGYEDVKTVALARLAAPGIASIQIDWRRYGPKLAQVALTFGADDVHGISASDEAPEGRRRAPLEEIRRNIEAAGFVPAERDGRYQVRS